MSMFVHVFDCLALTSAFICTVAVSHFFCFVLFCVFFFFLSGDFLITVTIIIAL